MKFATNPIRYYSINLSGLCFKQIKNDVSALCDCICLLLCLISGLLLTYFLTYLLTEWCLQLLSQT